MKHLKYFEIATNDEVSMDIQELKKVLENLIGDEYDVEEIRSNRTDGDIIGLYNKKGIYYQFFFTSNRINLVVHCVSGGDKNIENRCRKLLEVGMLPFYQYLDSNGYKYANAQMAYDNLKRYGRMVKMSIWRTDY